MCVLQWKKSKHLPNSFIFNIKSERIMRDSTGACSWRMKWIDLAYKKCRILLRLCSKTPVFKPFLLITWNFVKMWTNLINFNEIYETVSEIVKKWVCNFVSGKNLILINLMWINLKGTNENLNPTFWMEICYKKLVKIKNLIKKKTHLFSVEKHRKIWIIWISGN